MMMMMMMMLMMMMMMRMMMMRMMMMRMMRIGYHASTCKKNVSQYKKLPAI